MEKACSATTLPWRSCHRVKACRRASARTNSHVVKFHNAVARFGPPPRGASAPAAKGRPGDSKGHLPRAQRRHTNSARRLREPQPWAADAARATDSGTTRGAFGNIGQEEMGSRRSRNTAQCVADRSGSSFRTPCPKLPGFPAKRARALREAATERADHGLLLHRRGRSRGTAAPHGTARPDASHSPSLDNSPHCLAPSQRPCKSM